MPAKKQDFNNRVGFAGTQENAKDQLRHFEEINAVKKEPQRQSLTSEEAPNFEDLMRDINFKQSKPVEMDDLTIDQIKNNFIEELVNSEYDGQENFMPNKNLANQRSHQNLHAPLTARLSTLNRDQLAKEIAEARLAIDDQVDHRLGNLEDDVQPMNNLSEYFQSQRESRKMISNSMPPLGRDPSGAVAPTLGRNTSGTSDPVKVNGIMSKLKTQINDLEDRLEQE